MARCISLSKKAPLLSNAQTKLPYQVLQARSTHLLSFYQFFFNFFNARYKSHLSDFCCTALHIHLHILNKNSTSTPHMLNRAIESITSQRLTLSLPKIHNLFPRLLIQRLSWMPDIHDQHRAKYGHGVEEVDEVFVAGDEDADGGSLGLCELDDAEDDTEL